MFAEEVCMLSENFKYIFLMSVGILTPPVKGKLPTKNAGGALNVNPPPPELGVNLIT